MPAISPNSDTWSDMMKSTIAHHDSNTESMARVLGVPPQTLKNWLRDDRAPNVKWLIQNAARLPDDVRLSLLLVLAGPRYVIEQAPDASDDASVIGHMLDVHTLFVDLSRDVIDAEAKGRWFRDDVKRVIGRLALVCGKLRTIGAHVAAANGRPLIRRVTWRTA